MVTQKGQDRLRDRLGLFGQERMAGVCEMEDQLA
jgi:hypothetical protein